MLPVEDYRQNDRYHSNPVDGVFDTVEVPGTASFRERMNCSQQSIEQSENHPIPNTSIPLQ
jgi:hypothetical protein